MSYHRKASTGTYRVFLLFVTGYSGGSVRFVFSWMFITAIMTGRSVCMCVCVSVESYWHVLCCVQNHSLCNRHSVADSTASSKLSLWQLWQSFLHPYSRMHCIVGLLYILLQSTERTFFVQLWAFQRASSFCLRSFFFYWKSLPSALRISPTSLTLANIIFSKLGMCGTTGVWTQGEKDGKREREGGGWADGVSDTEK